LWDAGAGISVGGRHIANWLIGQVRDETQTEEKMREYAHSIDADETNVIEAFREVPSMSQTQFRHVAQALFTMANQLSTIAYQNIQQARFITELKYAERVVRESEEKYRRIVETANEGIISLDSNARVTFINQQMTTMLGYGIEEMLGQKFESFIIEDQISDHRAQMKIRAQGQDAVYERCFIKKDGGKLWTLISARAILDVDGKPDGSFGMISDITERKQAEAELAESHEMLTNLACLVPGVIYQYKLFPDGRSAFPYSSPGMNDIYEVTPKDVQTDASSVFGRLHPDDYDRVADSIQESARTLQTFYCEFRVILPRQGLRWRWSQAQPERLADGGTLWYGIISDITERKQAEAEILQYRDHLEELVSERTAELLIAKDQAEAANRAKGDFLAIMSHEIRTPLNGVMGMAHLVMQTELTPKQSDYMARLQSSSEILLATINDILDFSKIEAGKLNIERANFNLDDVLHELANLVAARAQEKSLELVFHTEVNVPRMLIGDRLRLGQVLLNLLGNAIKFTPAGEIVVRVRLLKQINDHILLEFSVRDTGIGLTEEQISHLFQPFSQADTSTSRKYGGTGLGLTISQRLVKMMGGEISAQSQAGVGSVFTFTIEVEQQAGADREAFVTAPELSGLRVLVVDDHPATREFLQSMLESFAFRVSTVQSAEKGLLLLDEQGNDPFGLVLLDWNLRGELDGMDVARRIRQNDKLVNIPIIYLVSKEEMLQKAGVEILNGSLVKPITRSQLFDAVMQVFGHKDRAHIRPTHQIISAHTLGKLHGKHVLLVEDNETNQMVAREILQQMGLRVSVASNGEQAVQMAVQGCYDAILMDINMPGMDGYEATSQIRGAVPGFTPKNAQIPIIAMTAYALDGDNQKALEAGLNDYVSKPVDVAQLANVLLRWLDNPASKNVSPHETQTSEEPDAIPELTRELLPVVPDSLDMVSALARLGGNKELYHRLLLMFRTDHTQDAQAIRAALESKNSELAHRLAHTLKGLAGTIGADELRAAAKQLEGAIAEMNEPFYDEYLALLERNLSIVIVAIANTLQLA
jgi:PAS domain S-box-containing protein